MNFFTFKNGDKYSTVVVKDGSAKIYDNDIILETPDVDR